MNFWEWFGLILAILPVVISGWVFRFDLWLWITGKQDISEGVWAERDLWRAGKGRFPWRIVYLPALMSLSGVGLLIHFLT